MLEKNQTCTQDKRAELQNYEQCKNDATSEDENEEIEQIIPVRFTFHANTTLECSLIINHQSKEPSVELQLTVSSNAIFRAVILFAEGCLTHKTSGYTIYDPYIPCLHGLNNS
ncbi:unnamed protein product [Onchocerca flexuosa]|uniref:BBS2_C domain-containing protein n=1 Tax=Onchocerca flexuosa TaxID=387005 RepID=A0A183HV35_9BILA|nr:unnamed protein product [Onchocerca flexuosa]